MLCSGVSCVLFSLGFLAVPLENKKFNSRLFCYAYTDPSGLVGK